MSGVNKVILVGRLGKEPEVKRLDSGSVLANLSIAVSETYKDRNTGERKEQTEWVNIVLWGKLAEVTEKYLKKGDQIYIEGKLRTRTWEKDGVTFYRTEIHGHALTMLGSANRDQSSQNSRDQQQNREPEPEVVHAEEVASEEPDDDLPF